MAAVLGARLPEGKLSDAGVERVNIATRSLLQLPAADFDKPRAKTKQGDLDDLAAFLDHVQNPAAYRICQDAAMQPEVVDALLGLSARAPGDALRCKGMEVLLRMAFGSEGAAAEIAANPAFLQLIDHSVNMSAGPHQLVALQLAQAVVASLPQGGGGAAVVPSLLERVAPLFDTAAFGVLAQASFDIFVSASFTFAVDCAAVLPPLVLAGLAAEDARRPAWLRLEPLYVLTSGLLVANILAAEGAGDESTRQCILNDLASGSFIEYFSCAVEAAASQTEWPAGSGAYHSPARLAKLVQHLAGLSFQPRLVAVVPQLVRIVEATADMCTTDTALVALRSLASDVDCLDVLLGCTEFRQEALRSLRDSGEHPMAAELDAYLSTVELHFEAARAVLDASRPHIPNAPSVHQLAEWFSGVGRLDAELPSSALCSALPRIPIGPSATVQASMSSGVVRSFSFQDFARQIYGTPTTLGWWPSLMEECSRLWKLAEANLGPTSYTLPSLVELVAIFEQGSEGKSTLSVELALEQLLPGLQLPMDSQAVEDAFAAIRGRDRLSLPEFAGWLGELFASLALEERDAAAAAEEEQRQQAAIDS